MTAERQDSIQTQTIITTYTLLHTSGLKQNIHPFIATVTAHAFGHSVYTVVYTVSRTSQHFDSEVFFYGCPTRQLMSVLLSQINPQTIPVSRKITFTKLSNSNQNL